VKHGVYSSTQIQLSDDANASQKEDCHGQWSVDPLQCVRLGYTQVEGTFPR